MPLYILHSPACSLNTGSHLLVQFRRQHEPLQRLSTGREQQICGLQRHTSCQARAKKPKKIEESDIEVQDSNVLAEETGHSSSGSNVEASLAEIEASIKDGTFDVGVLEKLIPAAEQEVKALVAKTKEAENFSEQLQHQLEAATDTNLRLNADFDNFRKRSTIEKEQLNERIRGDIIKSLVPLIDSFEAAQNSVKPENDGESKITAAYQGLYKQMVETFKSLGVEAVPGVGQPFDPEFHDAIMRESSSDVPEGTVLQELRRGFRLGKTLLRPAMVKVSYSEEPAQPEGNGAVEEEEPIDIPLEAEAAVRDSQ